MKNLSSRQVRRVQKLSKYYLQIDYYQGKANRAASVLSQYSKQNVEEKISFKAKNNKIFHCLQLSLEWLLRLAIEVFFLLQKALISETAMIP